MKKNPIKPAQDHPVDQYFREQEVNIPVTFDEAHWTALQNMLRSERPQNPGIHGSSAPEDSGSAPGIGAFRLLMVLAIAALLCSSTWMVFVYQQQPHEQGTEQLSGHEIPEIKGMNPVAAPVNEPADESNLPDNPVYGSDTELSSPAEAHPNPGPVKKDSIDALPAGISVNGKADSSSLRTLPAKDSVQIRRKKHLFW